MMGVYFLAPVANAMLSGIDEKMALRSFAILMVANAINVHYPSIYLTTGVPNVFSIPSFDVWFLYFISGWLIYRSINLFTWRAIALMITENRNAAP